MSITILIIILTCLVSYQGFNQAGLFDQFKHHPYAEQQDKEYIRLLTAGFLHGSWTHLLINMFVFYQFGEYVENYLVMSMGGLFGRLVYLLIYLTVIPLANIPTMIKHRDHPGFASIGASGAVSGILFMFIVLNPWAMLGIFFVIPCPAIVAGVLYLIYSSWASKNSRDHIDHDAHFFGAIIGMGLLLMVQPHLFTHFINSLTALPF